VQGEEKRQDQCLAK